MGISLNPEDRDLLVGNFMEAVKHMAEESLFQSLALGKVLVDKGVLTQEELDAAKKDAASWLDAEAAYHPVLGPLKQRLEEVFRQLEQLSAEAPEEDSDDADHPKPPGD